MAVVIRRSASAALTSRERSRSYTRKGPGLMPYRKRPNPPGTKFLRRCIRRSGTESVENRRLYAALAGRQYRG